MQEKLLTPEEAAELLRVSPKSVREWLRTRKLKGVKVGRLWRIREDALKSIIIDTEEQKETESEEARAERIAAIRSLRGKFKHLCISSEEFMREKQEDLDREEQRWKELHGE